MCKKTCVCVSFFDERESGVCAITLSHTILISTPLGLHVCYILTRRARGPGRVCAATLSRAARGRGRGARGSREKTRDSREERAAVYTPHAL